MSYLTKIFKYFIFINPQIISAGKELLLNYSLMPKRNLAVISFPFVKFENAGNPEG